MAEFKEVVEKRNRMCGFYACCSDCPLCGKNCINFKYIKIKEFEEIVMNWEEPIKELTVEDAEKLPKGTEIEVSNNGKNWVARKIVATYKDKIWCDDETEYLASWKHARLPKEK